MGQALGRIVIVDCIHQNDTTVEALGRIVIVDCKHQMDTTGEA